MIIKIKFSNKKNLIVKKPEHNLTTINLTKFSLKPVMFIYNKYLQQRRTINNDTIFQVTEPNQNTQKLFFYTDFISHQFVSKLKNSASNSY